MYTVKNNFCESSHQRTDRRPKAKAQIQTRVGFGHLVLYLPNMQSMAYDPRLPAGLGMPNMASFSASARPSHAAASEPSTRTLDPIVTGTGVVGIKFNGGVMLAADTLGSSPQNLPLLSRNV
jgi:hypothetical protein